MKNLNLIKQLSFLAAFIFIHAITSTQAHAATCAVNNSTDKEITDASVNAGCTVTPDTVYFPVYKIGLCKEVPTFENYQTTCNIFYDNTTAVEVEVSKSSNLNLKSGVSLDNGTYKAAIILLGNTIALKHSENFEGKRTGVELEDGAYVNTSGSASNGTVCVTRTISGNEDDLGTNGLQSFLTCYEPGDPELPAAGKFSETSGAYSTGGDVCSIDTLTGLVVAPSALTVTASNNDTVKFCGLLNNTTLETYSNGNTNATRQLAIQTFQTPVVTTSTTKSIDIGFKVTDMLSLEKRNVNSVDYTNAFIDGVSLTFTVE